MSEGGRGGGGQLTSEGGDLLRSRMPREAIYSGEDCTGVQVTPGCTLLHDRPMRAGWGWANPREINYNATRANNIILLSSF